MVQPKKQSHDDLNQMKLAETEILQLLLLLLCHRIIGLEIICRSVSSSSALLYLDRISCPKKGESKQLKLSIENVHLAFNRELLTDYIMSHIKLCQLNKEGHYQADGK